MSEEAHSSPAKISMMRNSCKRVYTRMPGVPHEINTTGQTGYELTPQPHFIEGAINGTNHRCLEFRNRARIEYRNRMNLFVTSAYRAATVRPLTN